MPKDGRVEPTLLVDQVYDALRRRIANGEWAPGRQLRIKEVAAVVGTSEMPVREAFRRLAQAGLITVEPYRGAVVRMLRAAELENTYEVRMMLEAEAGRQGALRATDTVLAEMNRHWTQIQEATARGDIVDAVGKDEELLLALYDAGGNDVLVNIVRGVWDTCRPYKHLWASHAVEQGVSAWDHVPQLIAAVTRHDADEVYAVIRKTYADARTTVGAMLDEKADA